MLPLLPTSTNLQKTGWYDFGADFCGLDQPTNLTNLYL